MAYWFILGILFGSRRSALGARPMAASPVRPLGPEGAPPGPGPGPALPRAIFDGPFLVVSRAIFGLSPGSINIPIPTSSVET